jgi:2OG-Fe(II) oxygenase superfamily
MEAFVKYNNSHVKLNYEILAPGIYVYKNAIPKEWDCVNRIENALAKPGTRFKWELATLNFGRTDEDYRNCRDFKVIPQTLGEFDEYSQDMYVLYDQVMNSLKTILTHYCSDNYLAMVEYFECINIVRYGKGEYFKTHTDDGVSYRCTVSSVGYPNDNYEGGELYFPKFDVKYKAEAGDFVICPSSFVYAHSSEPVLDDGVKYSFVIMADRNEFAHKNDSPTYHPKEYREQLGIEDY